MKSARKRTLSFRSFFPALSSPLSVISSFRPSRFLGPLAACVQQLQYSSPPAILQVN
eukprot:m.15057 g.15057  ORF g.15057 m.15057 type:complete len:57 (+) comp7780_c0_seq1:400-570(+)